MLIEEYQPQNGQDIQEALKDLLGDTMEELLKAALDQHLDYEYGEKPLSLNTRNGTSKKMWVGENESSKYWLLVLNQLKERGLEDVLIFSTDNLPGFTQAIEAVYPKAEIHPNSAGKIMHNPPNKKLNKICILQRYKITNERPKSCIQGTTEDLALTNLGIFEEKWDKKYPMCVSSWKNNRAELSTYFKYPEGIRKLIYTTNAMEHFNRQLRKVTKNKTIFPNDYALQKSLYLTMVDASSKWTYRIRGWDQILSQLSIFFEGRF